MRTNTRFRSFRSSKIGRKVLWAALVAPVLSTAGYVGASHKNWTRLDGGTSCIEAAFNIASGVTVQNEATWNSDTESTASVVCPIKMGGIFQDSAKGITQHTKVPSLRLQVYYYDGSSVENLNTGCEIIALTRTGSAHFTPFLTGCPTVGGCKAGAEDPFFAGGGHLEFADPTRVANRRIGIPNAATVSDVRSYKASCLVGPAGSAGWSGLIGILSQTCQREPTSTNAPCWE